MWKSRSRPAAYWLSNLNVGECTRAAMPRPRARPLTSWVLPAPRSPVRPITQPRCASRPHASPSACVSSALCEMNVAMQHQLPFAILVAQSQPALGGDLADATQLHGGKLLLPRVEQRHGERELMLHGYVHFA